MSDYGQISKDLSKVQQEEVIHNGLEESLLNVESLVSQFVEEYIADIERVNAFFLTQLNSIKLEFQTLKD